MPTLRRQPQAKRGGPQLESYQVVRRPLITEKATMQAEYHNAYTFAVNRLATKTEIKKAIEELFEVKVENVRTQNIKSVSKRFRFKVGKTKNWKKAVVKLKPDYRIDFF